MPFLGYNKFEFMEFKVGDLVIHCRDGLSRISAMRNIDGSDFFVVISNRSDSETIYVPLSRASAIIRPIMSKEEADGLFAYMNTIAFDFNKNTKQRRDLFKKKLNSGDVKELSYLFRQNYLYKKHPDEVRLGPVDLDMLNYASNNFLDEFALTYNVPRPIVEDFVYQKFH